MTERGIAFQREAAGDPMALLPEVGAPALNSAGAPA